MTMPECEPGAQHIWEMCEGYCETCGGHDAFVCAECGEVVDPMSGDRNDMALFHIIQEELRHG